MSIRDYGLGESTQYVTGPPTIDGPPEESDCPNCKGVHTLFNIVVPVEHPLLHGKIGVGSYIGCAACAFASPMMMRATT